MTTLPQTSPYKVRSKLDRAIAASIAAMGAMSLFMLAQQLHLAPEFAAAGAAMAQRA